jgi:hypothetical protein
MRIIICATLLAVASINAEAGTPITAGNVLQPSCNPVQIGEVCFVCLLRISFPLLFNASELHTINEMLPAL